MLRTRFTELVGCTVPIQQAGIGKLASPALAAAVADAGGLGMVSGIGAAPPEYVAKILDGLRRSTSGAFGANFLIDGVRETGKLDADFLKVLEVAASRAPVVEFFYEQPDAELVEMAHAGGALVSWQLGSAAEAAAAERAGCDLIVAQGTEAGGHVRGKIGLLALLGEFLPSAKVPVVAAGASAVRVGTRFVAAEEAGTHPAYVNKLIAAGAKDTVLTEAFSANWPNAPHRVLRSCVEAVERFRGEFVGETAWPWAPDVRVPNPEGGRDRSRTSRRSRDSSPLVGKVDVPSPRNWRMSGAKRQKRPAVLRGPWEPRLIARRPSSPARIAAWGSRRPSSSGPKDSVWS